MPDQPALPTQPTTLGPGQKYCSACSALLDARAEICPKCGIRQAAPPPKGDAKSKLAAGLLAILLGGLGIHKFYLKRVGWGIVYLLFCWTGIPMVVAFIEGIVYLAMDDAKFHAKYG